MTSILNAKATTVRSYNTVMSDNSLLLSRTNT